MKIVPKGSVCSYTLNGNLKKHISNIKIGDIIEFKNVIYALENTNKELTQLGVNKGKVIKINCPFKLSHTNQNASKLLEIQYDLLIELPNKLRYYVSSINCTKLINTKAGWNNFLSR